MLVIPSSDSSRNPPRTPSLPAAPRPGNGRAEAKLVEHALGGVKPPYSCGGAVVYRLAAPEADHYFLTNDGPATCVELDTGDFAYTGVIDAVTEKELELGAEVDLPP
ncbi:MAG: hypothetical protein ACYS9X_06315 [Planctomycetota bacterium]|jgi:beta-galactosidase